MNLSRPLIIFDLETTGVDPSTSRIVELSALRIEDSILDPTSITEDSWYLNPGIPIPKEASDIHGIHDADVAKSASFQELAPEIHQFFHECDLAGFNSNRFDVPLLEAEFNRCRPPLSLNLPVRHLIDVCRIYHTQYPRNLTAAVAHYLDRSHDGAHTAASDTQATLEVLQAQLRTHPDLPDSLYDLHVYCDPDRSSYVDFQGRLRWNAENEIIFTFGKLKGKTLKQAVSIKPDYLCWILSADFPNDVKRVINDALSGIYPDPPEGLDDKANPTP